MKKRLMLLIIAAALVFTVGCGANESVPAENTEQEDTEMHNTDVYSPSISGDIAVPSNPMEYSEEEPLFALVETQDAAEKIASDYGIELVDFSYGVATYYTDKDPSELINWGKEQGLAPLEINYTSHLY